MTGGGDARPPRLLVVDDDPAIVDLLDDFFAAHGYIVEAAGDGRAALDAVRSNAPDVVLLDLTLPGLEGTEVLNKLRALAPRLPVIVVTGRADLGLWADMLKRGAFECVAKPFSLADLDALVRSALHRHP